MCCLERSDCIADCLWQDNCLREVLLFLANLFAAVYIVAETREMSLEDMELCHYFIDFLAPSHLQAVPVFFWLVIFLLLLVRQVF